MKLSSTARLALIATGITTLVASLAINGYLLTNKPKSPFTPSASLSIPSNTSTDQTGRPKPYQPELDISLTHSTVTHDVVELDFAWQNPTAQEAQYISFLYHLGSEVGFNTDLGYPEVLKRGTVKSGAYKDWQLVTASTDLGLGGAYPLPYLIPPITNPYQNAYSVQFTKSTSSVDVSVHNNIETTKVLPLYIKEPEYTVTLPNGKILSSTQSEYIPGWLSSEPSPFTTVYKTLKSKEGFTIDVTNKANYYIHLPGGRSVFYNEPLRQPTQENSEDLYGLANAGIKKDFIFQQGGLDTRSSGCGGASTIVYVDETAPKDTDAAIIFRSSDLEIIKNTSTTRPIYRVKNLQHPSYKKAYELWYQPDWNNQTKPDFETFMAQHDLPFFLTKDSMGTWDSYVVNGVGVVAECGKPVIYLYPTTTTEISVKLPPTIDVTVSEPTYPHQGWTTIAEPSGQLTMADGNTYGSLFWEGYGATYKTPTTGFIVKGNEVESFLQKTLAQYGLNVQESKDFMDFWVPIMKPYNTMRISFVTDEWSKNVPLSVSPEPQTSIRIFMDWSPVSSDATIKAPTITTPSRDGYTLVEWGGLLRK